MEEREKLVKHMWDVFMNSKRVALPNFWKDAFVAAYEDLISDLPEVREAAITEIARMSIHYDKILSKPVHSSSSLIGLIFNSLIVKHLLDFVDVL